MPSVAAAPASPLDLSTRLRHETAVWHQRVERGGLMADLVSGRIEGSRYLVLLRNLHALYEALEHGLDAAGYTGPQTGWWSPALRRTQALAADLDHLHGGPWREDLGVVAAMQDYGDHLHALTRSDPLRLVAHAYLRYLGDLHGGQILARRVRERLGLSDAHGTRFYDFGDPVALEPLRRQFRAGLARLDLTAAQADAVVAEALDAYARHERVFDEIAAAALPA